MEQASVSFNRSGLLESVQLLQQPQETGWRLVVCR